MLKVSVLSIVCLLSLSSCAYYAKPIITSGYAKQFITISTQTQVISKSNPISALTLNLGPEVTAELNALTQRGFSQDQLTQTIQQTLEKNSLFDPKAKGNTLEMVVTKAQLKNTAAAMTVSALLGDYGPADFVEADVVIKNSKGDSVIKAHVKSYPLAMCQSRTIGGVPVAGCTVQERTNTMYGYMATELVDLLSGKFYPEKPE